ncbi:hypothetical protein [Asanoa sp. NPDC049475]
MFRISRRSVAEAGVQFCDSCAEVTTADERARRRHERARQHLAAALGPR